MGKLGRKVVLAIILLITISTVGLASAQSIPKPSVPEFTLRFVPSHVVPATTPTYTIDPNTGQQRILIPAHPIWHVGDYIEIIIKNNEIFTSYFDSKQNQIALYYNVDYKEHNEADWQPYTLLGVVFGQNSTSDTTIIPFNQLPDKGGTIDFRVQAQIGYYTLADKAPVPIIQGFVGQTSDWSNTQTITIPASSTSPTISSTISPTVSPNEERHPVSIPLIAAVGVIAVLVVLAGSLLLFRRHQRSSKQLTA